MRKFILSVIVVGASALYVFMRGLTSPAAALPTAPAATTNPTSSPTTPAPSASAQTDSSMMSQMQQRGMMHAGLADGTYTGPSVDAFYGYVQVQAIVTNGRLADVTFLSYPNDRSTSRFINTQAMPMLTQEAITAQGAKVNIISGATDTSLAFEQSLASALAKAGG